METRQKIKELCKLKGIPVSRVEKELGFSNGSLLRPRSFKGDKLLRIANYFNVSPESLLDDDEATYVPQPIKHSKTVNLSEGLYIDADALAFSEAVRNRPQLKTLFKSANGVSEENLRIIVDLLDRLKELESRGEL